MKNLSAAPLAASTHHAYRSLASVVQLTTSNFKLLLNEHKERYVYDRWEDWKAELRAIIQANYRVSLMNNTKWEEVKNLLRRLNLSYRTKLITGAEISRWGHAGLYLPTNWIDHHGPVYVLQIEWLEVDPRQHIPRPYVGPDRFIDHTEEVEQQLCAIGAPFTKENGIYRIWGHVPKDAYPDFA
jgi:hypothetical protein